MTRPHFRGLLHSSCDDLLHVIYLQWSFTGHQTVYMTAVHPHPKSDRWFSGGRRLLPHGRHNHIKISAMRLGNSKLRAPGSLVTISTDVAATAATLRKQPHVHCDYVVMVWRQPLLTRCNYCPDGRLGHCKHEPAVLVCSIQHCL